MWHRKVVDEQKVSRLWWIETRQRKYFRKNRKKCNCWSCRNPRRTGLDTSKGNREQALLLQHKDEIQEAING